MITKARGFASDNASGVHPKVWEALREADSGHVPSYGGDSWTRRFEDEVAREFGPEARGFLVFNGTGANVLALQALVRPYESVLCTQVSHIREDECGAVERMTGATLVCLDRPDGKLSTADVEKHVLGFDGEVHHSRPGVVSISQTTERGRVYSREERLDLCTVAHRHGLSVHLDGARLSNASAASGLSLGELTSDLGVDVVCMGGTKNGLMFGEAVIFMNPRRAEHFGWIRKQGLQLLSKHRYLAAQFVAYLEGGLWRENALHANRMAGVLKDRILAIRGVELAYPTDANGVFVRLPQAWIEPVSRVFPFWVVRPEEGLCRFMTSFDTGPEEIDRMVSELESLGRLHPV